MLNPFAVIELEKFFDLALRIPGLIDRNANFATRARQRP